MNFKDTKLINRVIKTIAAYEMIRADDIVLVAVSGGPDSIFLLWILDHLKLKLKLKKLCVVNMDHGLRGDESREDSLFVKKMSDKLGLEYFHKTVNLKNIKSKKLSAEELARQARYEFFKEAADRIHANVIATGHTLDDQAETILMRLIKGSSLKGIVGISPAREEQGVRVIRPLLEIEKGEISRYLNWARIDYRIDSTNMQDKYFRNVVRAEIIPFLEKYNPRLKRALFNLAEHLREDFEFVEKERRLARRYISQGVKGAVEIRLKDIIIQPKAIQREVLRDALAEAEGEIKRLSFRHWKEMENLIKIKHKGNSVDLPGDIRVARTESSLVFKRR